MDIKSPAGRAITVVVVAGALALVILWAISKEDDSPPKMVEAICNPPYELNDDGDCVPPTVTEYPKTIGELDKLPDPKLLPDDLESVPGFRVVSRVYLDEPSVRIETKDYYRLDGEERLRQTKLLIVKGTWVIQANHAGFLLWEYDQFIMEEGSRVVFPPYAGTGSIRYGAMPVKLTASHAEFRGANELTTRYKNEKGKLLWYHEKLPRNGNLYATAGENKKGRKGISGTSGKPGAKVVSLTLEMGLPMDREDSLFTLDNLTINLSGFPGQDGNNGGRGQDGGPQSCNSGANVNGGPGGDRGLGGQGSPAGDFSLLWHLYNLGVSNLDEHLEDSVREWANTSVVLQHGQHGKDDEMGESGRGGRHRREHCESNFFRKLGKKIFGGKICRCRWEEWGQSEKTESSDLSDHPEHPDPTVVTTFRPPKH